jgi:hypothetical protein
MPGRSRARRGRAPSSAITCEIVLSARCGERGGPQKRQQVVRSAAPACMMDHLESGTRDVAIVGGGAAGVNAALVLGRARRDVILVDAGTPRNAPAAHMQGFLSRDGMRPTALLQTGRLEIERYGVEIVEERVVGAHPGITLRLAGGRTISTRQLLLATDELPDIPGVRERWRRDACTAPTVMAGSFATSRSAFSAPAPARATTPIRAPSGHATSCSSHASIRSPIESAERCIRVRSPSSTGRSSASSSTETVSVAFCSPMGVRSRGWLCSSGRLYALTLTGSPRARLRDAPRRFDPSRRRRSDERTRRLGGEQRREPAGPGDHRRGRRLRGRDRHQHRTCRRGPRDRPSLISRSPATGSPAAGQSTTTIFPRGCPSPWCRRASGTSVKG